MLFNTVLFTGNANHKLAKEIASQLGVELGQALVGRFSDGEVEVEIQQNVRARDIFVVQSTCAAMLRSDRWRSNTCYPAGTSPQCAFW